MGKSGSKLKFPAQINQDRDMSLLDSTIGDNSVLNTSIQTTQMNNTENPNNTSRQSIKNSEDLSKYKIVEILSPDEKSQKAVGLFGKVVKVLNVVNNKYYALKIIELYEDEISKIPKYVEQDYYKLRNLRSTECLLKLHGYKLDYEKVETDENDDDSTPDCDLYGVHGQAGDINVSSGEIDMSYSQKLLVARNIYLMEQRQKMSLLRIGLDEHGNKISKVNFEIDFKLFRQN
jgi:hypothetical protein